jgi:anti-sigma regulatory factor (Ser/Thr protein kinase)
MTAHGSETIAAEALARGAVDFVPKSLLATELVPAVRNVLAMSTAASRDQRINRYLRREDLEFEFGNDLTLIPPLVLRLQESAQHTGLVDESQGLRLSKALTEALRNAICHGNLELTADEWTAVRNSEIVPEFVSRRTREPRFQQRRVDVQARIAAERGEFTIRDEGPGFDTKSLKNLTQDPSQLTCNRRRGLLLIRAFADEMQFNERGNELSFVIRNKAEK